MPSRSDLVDRYAAVVVEVGVNVQPGQRVLVRALVEHLELARAVAEAAYAAGAERVDVLLDDQHVRRAGLAHGAGCRPRRGDPRRARRARARRAGAGGAPSWSASPATPSRTCSTTSTPRAVVASQPAEVALRTRAALMGGRLRWTIVAAPNPGWAATVFGEPDVDRLWEAVGTAVRLDEPDPVASWREHVERLHRRCAAVEALGLDALHYTGPGSDLAVGLHAGAGGTVAPCRPTTACRTCPTSPPRRSSRARTPPGPTASSPSPARSSCPRTASSSRACGESPSRPPSPGRRRGGGAGLPRHALRRERRRARR